MNCRHFETENESPTGFFVLSIHWRHEFLEKRGGGGGEGGCERLHLSFIMICARCRSKRSRAFGCIMSSLREAFVSWLRVGVME